MQILPIPYLAARQDTFLELYESPIQDPFRIVGRIVLRDGKTGGSKAVAHVSSIHGLEITPGLYRIRAFPPPIEQGGVTVQGVQIINLPEEKEFPYEHWPFVLFMRGIEREEIQR